MIRELESYQKYFYFTRYELLFGEIWKNDKAFVNDDNLLHNDIGRAYEDECGGGEWRWNGIRVR